MSKAGTSFSGSSSTTSSEIQEFLDAYNEVRGGHGTDLRHPRSFKHREFEHRLLSSEILNLLPTGGYNALQCRIEGPAIDAVTISATMPLWVDEVFMFST